MKRALERVSTSLPLALALVGAGLLVGCDPRTSSKTATTGAGGKANLIQMEYGRLVDIYSYRRVDPAIADRRATLNRAPTLVMRDVLIGAGVESESLFDAIGEVNPTADFRFLPFDVNVGHEELMILWDDTHESAEFNRALQEAQGGLAVVTPSYRNQNTAVRPIPVVPRNAAIALVFDRDLGLSNAFFQANPGAVQLLQFRADPSTVLPQLAYQPVTHRVLAQGRKLIIDTTIIGSEAVGGQASTGLPASEDNQTANIRIAIPANGVVNESFNVESDPVAALNGPGASGEEAVIRDFRSGNPNDGPAGQLADAEAPSVIAEVPMGIVDIDPVARIITLNKRFSQVAIRGRIPFVDGGIVPALGLPGGPAQVPTEVPLRSGDLLTQEVLLPSGEIVRLRAEILQNEDVANAAVPGGPTLGLTANGDDGGSLPFARVRVASLVGGRDSSGNEVMFRASSLPLGEDCAVRVHYYHNVPYNVGFGLASVSDAGRLNEFLVFNPDPAALDPERNVIPPGEKIDPFASVSLRFSEPMDLESVDPYGNFLLTNDSFRETNNVTVGELLLDPKASALSMIGTRLIDQERNATLLRLTPPMGLFHKDGDAETYWFHMLASGPGVVTDLGGNRIDLFDRDLLEPLEVLSASFKLDPEASDNWVASIVHRFESVDEDGTQPGSEDFFGQFQLNEGRLMAAATSRFSEVADQQTLSPIQRFDKGECWDTSVNPPMTLPPAATPGQLYQCPSHIVVRPAPSQTVFGGGAVIFGGVVEPLQPRGSRLQMTYREDDFSLGYTDASRFNLDVEQLHWAPWNGEAVQFDVFDRVTIALGHSDWRPDLRFFYNPPPSGTPPPPPPPTCDLDCGSMFSGLRTTFADNPLQGSTPVNVVTDRVYELRPNDVFQGATGTVFLPYPQFDRTYTWRDSRLASWDRSTQTSIGLSGAHEPEGVFPARDRTADVSSPWVDEELPPEYTGSVWTVSEADFRGDRARDHDPIAMPLLVDFKVSPDGAPNGFASGANRAHIALVGGCWGLVPTAHGYYNAPVGLGSVACNGVEWPRFRVHSSGGIDVSGFEITVEPGNATTATGGWIFDAGLGEAINARYKTGPGDDHLHWAQADFVRKVSLVTFGFRDTLTPNMHDLPTSYGVAWEGLGTPSGFPDFSTISPDLRMTDFIAVMDPPIARQPAGTGAELELRFAESFQHSGRIYNKPDENGFAERGNLLNPSYACEAFRYASANSGAGKTSSRIPATDLTPYVNEASLDSLRDVRGVLPRFMNYRLVLSNNIDTTPAQSPSLRSLTITYRMAMP